MAESPEEREGMSVQVSRSLLTELDRVAAAAGISRSDLVRMVLVDGLPRVTSRLKVKPAA